MLIKSLDFCPIKFFHLIIWVFCLIGISKAALLLPYGLNEGDQIITNTENSSISATTLPQPYHFFERKHTEIFISQNGAVSFSAPLSGSLELDAEKKDIIAAYYAPSTGGTIFYRSNQCDARNLLCKEISAKIRRAFPKSFEAQMVVLITWENVQNIEKTGTNTFQLALTTADSRDSSYVLFIYNKLEWAQSQNISAQVGFSSQDGRSEKIVNSGNPVVKDIIGFTNFNEHGEFLFYVSGSSPVDPRLEGEEGGNYDYPNTETDYNDAEQLADCPNDPFADNCPPQCNLMSDDKDCTLCICAKTVSDGAGSPSYSKVSVTDMDRAREPEEGQRVHLLDETDQKGLSVVNPSADFSCNPSEQASQCNSKANCIRFDSGGYCCECQPGYIGNGVQCRLKGQAQRIEGTIEGGFNGIQMETIDVFTYVETATGLQHTALSKIPTEKGKSLLLLDTLGNIFGWLFPKNTSDSEAGKLLNGFQLTGGIFNRTVTIHLGERYSISIQQKFTYQPSRDAYNVYMYLSGTLPDVSNEATIKIPPFQETYRRDNPGFIRAYDERHISVIENGAETKYRVTIDQQIHFIECPSKYTKNSVYIVKFDGIVSQHTHGNLIRFASQATLTSKPEKEDIPSTNIVAPSTDICATGNHYCTQPNMFCSPTSQSYRCECAKGFYFEADKNVEAGFRCVDLDECARRHHNCDRNARCENLIGSFTCTCNPGFTGDGINCQDEKTASKKSEPKKGMECTNHQQCHKYGECAFVPGTPTGNCKCRGHYEGDGVHSCHPPGEPVYPLPVDPQPAQQNCGDFSCDKNADCITEDQGYKTCVCRTGYQGNGVTCNGGPSRDTYEHGPSVIIGQICRSNEECGNKAKCLYSPQYNYYKCECQSPYYGDGVECRLDPRVNPDVEANKVDSCETKLGCHREAHCVAQGQTQSAICECNEGFYGNGIECIPQRPRRPIETPPTTAPIETPPTIATESPPTIGTESPPTIAPQPECSDQDDCHVNAHCVRETSASGKYVCECLPGFKGDGKRACISDEECNPSISQTCNLKPHSECRYSDTAHLYTCQCLQGFTKAPNSEICVPDSPSPPPKSPPPNNNEICGQCSPNAQCLQNHQEWQCICVPGFYGNGFDCRPEHVPAPVVEKAINCLDDKTICSVHAQCVPNDQSIYVCNCNYGYRGNGRHCAAILDHRESDLLIGRGMSIIQRSTNLDIPGKQLVVVAHQVVVDVAYDCESEKIYWSDISGHSIRWVFLNGTGLGSAFTEQLRSPEGIAIDSGSRNLYYVDSLRNELGVVSLNGKYQKTLLNEGLVNPRALVMDIVGGHLYYSDWHRQNPHIGRIDLDGSNNQIFLSGQKDDIYLPNGMTLLSLRRELCWVDAGSQKLSCINLGTSKARRVIYAGLEYPFGLTCYQEERFYWTDWKDHKIHSVSIHGTGYLSFVPGAGGKGKIYGILSLPIQCQRAPTHCTNNNGGCTHLCLPGQYGAVCKCPDTIDGQKSTEC